MFILICDNSFYASDIVVIFLNYANSDFLSLSRYASQPDTHHGQTGAGPVRAVQAGGGTRRSSRSY